MSAKPSPADAPEVNGYIGGVTLRDDARHLPVTNQTFVMLLTMAVSAVLAVGSKIGRMRPVSKL